LISDPDIHGATSFRGPEMASRPTKPESLDILDQPLAGNKTPRHFEIPVDLTIRG
jgi:hypothetical protein